MSELTSRSTRETVIQAIMHLQWYGQQKWTAKKPAKKTNQRKKTKYNNILPTYTCLLWHTASLCLSATVLTL